MFCTLLLTYYSYWIFGNFTFYTLTTFTSQSWTCEISSILPIFKCQSQYSRQVYLQTQIPYKLHYSSSQFASLLNFWSGSTTASVQLVSSIGYSYSVFVKYTQYLFVEHQLSPCCISCKSWKKLQVKAFHKRNKHTNRTKLSDKCAHLL